MIEVLGLHVELGAEDPEALAAFYERLLGLRREPAPQGEVMLRGATFGLRVRRAPPGAESESMGPSFGFAAAPGADAAAVKAEALACGAVVLVESKREGRTAMSCVDPAGNEFTILVGGAVGEAPAASRPEAAAQAPQPSSAPAQPTQPTQPSQPAPPVAPRPRAVTRRDWDQLRDAARLAEMQEAVAGLDAGFATNDPAHVMDEMRAKIGAPPDDAARARAEADAEAAARTRAAQAEEMLRRYKESAAPRADADEADAHPAAGSGGGPARTLGPSRADDVADPSPPRRSLGGSNEPDEPTGKR
jgi:predicted enzyme related to lactoylglutathione lyase